MMFFQGWAFATSPQGASQTIFKPGNFWRARGARQRREVGRLRGGGERESDGEQRQRDEAKSHERHYPVAATA